VRASTLGSIVISMVFFTPACGVLFRCGCKTLWGGAAQLCSINIGPPPPCPWCESTALGLLGAVLAVVPLLLPWAVAAKRPMPVWTPIALIVPGYLFAGAITFLLTPYPHFLIRGLREMIGLPAGPLG
jgi:hypothetical protein